MRKIKQDNQRWLFICDNLREYLNEFTEFRNSPDGFERNPQPDYYYLKEEGMIFYVTPDYENPSRGRITDFLMCWSKGYRIELTLSIPSSVRDDWSDQNPEWLSQREKIKKTLKEIWKTGEFKNTYNLDLNWPQSSRQPDRPPTEKKELDQALTTLKYQKSPTEAKKILAAHIGFKKEKKWFEDQVYLYSATHGNFTPTREIICYAGPPGTGKTTFIYRLEQATGRPCQTIACAGQKEFSDFSILGTKNKPSLVAWAIKESGCRNPLILLDELEKVSNHQILKDLIKLLSLYRQKEKLFDPYFQTEIDLSQVTFFATVNYAEQLAPLLKNNFLIRKLEKLAPPEKRLILTAKSRQLEKEWGATEGEIIPVEIINALAQFPEEGVRQSEAVLSEILKEWIIWKAEPSNQGKKFSLGNPQEWLAKNEPVAPASFQMRPQYYPLFALWFIIWILAAVLIAKKFILKKPKTIYNK
ncbi:MAG: AAA family ATPase [Candidatus Moeniiplasma glomeromycotorum]|nr:AAA family ATPase [Candidatus Moeniiplasma glomeromycotorum]MCE8168216.1 AAA family ATPase [Candidatus Moeniiplasma glomeromycotorum]MCE8169749.1 AAA family ATPase [Candidatus Moeniiplasma glomeromycotorum]